MVLLYILLAAALAWAVLSPLYPEKPPLTPEEAEAARIKAEAAIAQLEQFSSVLFFDVFVPLVLIVVFILGVSFLRLFLGQR